MIENLNWHNLDSKNVFDKTYSSLKGLSEEEAVFRLKEFGENKLTLEKKQSKLKLFFGQFNEPIIYILMCAAVITLIIGDISDSIVIMVATFLNAIIGYVQELKSDDAMKALAKMAALKAKVRRSRKDVIIDSERIVPGDIVLLESGTKIPADLRLVEANNLSIDESMLTGESVQIHKTTEPVKDENPPIAEKINMAFSGTIVTRGRGCGVVIATGKHTEFGKIAKMISEQEQPLSPLQIQLAKFGKAITTIVVAAVILIFILGELLRHIPLTEMALTAVGLAVSAIPEGLPIAVTVTLSIGLYKMSKRNAIIRRLAAVETLGSTTIICSDKTGTLTKNEMTVNDIYSGGQLFTVTGTGYNPVGEFLLNGEKIDPKQNNDLIKTLCIGYICNESKLESTMNRYKVVGDPTEGALLASGLKADIENNKMYRNIEVESVIPFESDNQYMASLVNCDGKYYIFIKGSFEKILELSNKEAINENIVDINEERLKTFFNQMTGKGLRVLALAFKPLDRKPEEFTENDIAPGFILSGLQGMMDPPREEVITAIRDCHIAGIKVVMITGDHQKTAEVIAKRLGIAKDDISVLTGKDLDSMTDNELFKQVNYVNVFARVSPAHKLRIVTQLKKHGHIAAMTGDGVNDAPALKASDIGIAMGSGTDVAKEASSMVVADDNFASIFSAVEYGRIIYNNLQNILLFVLTTSVGGMLTILISILIGFPIPFSPVQILWINLVTDGTSTVPLAFEEGEKDVIYQKPRDPGSNIISPRMIVRLLITSILMCIMILVVFKYEIDSMSQSMPYNDAVKYARTIAFTTFAFLQIFNAHNCRSFKRSLFSIGVFKNKYLLMVHSISITLQIILVETEIGWASFSTVPLGMGLNSGWITIIGITLFLILTVEVLKFVERQLDKPNIIAK
jgi:magnesium-transporting ATPase (P-type)